MRGLTDSSLMLQLELINLIIIILKALSSFMIFVTCESFDFTFCLETLMNLTCKTFPSDVFVAVEANVR